MAGPIEAVAVTSPGPREGYAGPLGGFGWGLSWLDYGVYSVERIIVITSLIAMTVMEFVYILSLYIIEQRINFKLMAAPGSDAAFPIGLPILLSFVFVLLLAVVNNTSLGKKADGDKRPLGLRIGAAVGLLAATSGFASLTVVFEESRWFYLLLLTAIMGPSIAYFVMKKLTRSAVIVGGFTVLAFWAAWEAPSGYSWADKRSLFLLLWVGFLGASMAAKQGRHIRIDAFRKAVPARFLPRYNAVSLLLAAAFTGLLVYIGGIYLFHEDYGRFWARTIPGEIPDWLKVASIPIAFLLITLRFTAKGIRLLVWGEPPTPTNDDVEVTP